jgi:hypothetical protein
MSISALASRCRHELDPSIAPLVFSQLSAIDQRPTNPHRLYVLGQLFRDLGRNDLWREATAIAFSLPHRTAQQIYERGLAKLLLGDWSGWKDREARLSDPDEAVWQLEYWRNIRWTTVSCENVADWTDQAIFVIADGDDADSIRMLRFIQVVARQASQVIVGVSPAMVPFVRHNVGGDRVVVTFRHVEHERPFTRYAWLQSLPALCGALPPFAPFTAPQPMPRLSETDSRLHVGWWQGTAGGLSLGTLDGIELHAVRSTPDPVSYSALANQLGQFDYLVTTDAPIAHLAGSMGMPTMVVLPCGADVRWGFAKTTPWYPSVSLVHQIEPGRWSHVADAISEELISRSRRLAIATTLAQSPGPG